MSETHLNDDQKRFLILRATTLIDEKKFLYALDYLNDLVEGSDPDVNILDMRSTVLSALGKWDAAIADLRKAVRLSPDDASYHLNLGIYRTLQLFGSDPHHYKDHYPTLQEVQGHYSDSLARNPSNRTAWMNFTETHLFLRQWDLAISAYADSRPYITCLQNQVTHSWLGCLALALSGEPIFDEDQQRLNDQSIRLPSQFHDTRQVEILLKELADDDFNPGRLTRAQAIHEKYLRHFDSET